LNILTKTQFNYQNLLLSVYLYIYMILWLSFFIDDY